MSIFKQMEGSELTLEEIQEVVLLLTDVLPKVKRRVDAESKGAILARNLREKLASEGSITVPEGLGSKCEDLEKGYKLLESATVKLTKFKESIIGS